MAVTLKFVDKIDAAPTTRLDLNDGVIWSLLEDGTDFAPPPLKQSVASTLLRDGAEIPASAYDNRVVVLSLFLKKTTQDDVATELQKLFRELDRGRNILKLQTNGASKPVFFRTFRSAPAGWRPIPGMNAGKHGMFVSLAITAEPFAYGLEVRGAEFLLYNDPAHAAPAMFFDVIDVTGDVPTPLYLWTDDPVDDKTLLAVRRHGDPTVMTYFHQLEGWTTSTDTAVAGAHDAAMSGAGNNYMRTDFATTVGMTKRLEKTGIVADSVDLRGRYRVLVRLRKSVAGNGINVRAKTAGITGKTKTCPAIAGPFWLDLGLFHFPAGVDPIYRGYSGEEYQGQGLSMQLEAERTSGAGNVDWDVLAFVPADEEMCFVDWIGSSNGAVWDGPQDQCYPLSSTGAGDETIAHAAAPARAGGIPLLSPNQRNRIFYFETIDDDADDVTSNSNLRVSYWPRFLYIRPT